MKMEAKENPKVVYEISEANLESLAATLINKAKKLLVVDRPQKSSGRVVSLDKLLEKHSWLARQTFYEKAGKGLIPGASKPGKIWVIDLDAFEQWVRDSVPKSQEKILEEAIDHVSKG